MNTPAVSLRKAEVGAGRPMGVVCDRLRRDEPPNPTPARVRAVRRDGEAMRLAARGAPNGLLARRFGFPSPEAAGRAVERARDRVFPFDIVFTIPTERRALHALMAAVRKSLYPSAGDARIDGATRLMLRSARLELRARDAVGHLRVAECGAAWSELLTADLGEWTSPLAMRAEGRSFHEIADALGLWDFFDANEIVFTDLVRYQQGCAVELRVRQVADLTRQLREVWPAATRAPLVDLRAASRAMSILERRWRVRGIGVPFKGPLVNHAPEVLR